MLYGGIFAVYCESRKEHKTQAVVKDLDCELFFHTFKFIIHLSYIWRWTLPWATESVVRLTVSKCELKWSRSVIYIYITLVIRITYVRAERSGDRIPVAAGFAATVHTGPGAHPAPATMGNVSLSREKSGRRVVLTKYLHLASRLKEE